MLRGVRSVGITDLDRQCSLVFYLRRRPACLSFPSAQSFSTAFHRKNPLLVTNNLDRGYRERTMKWCAIKAAT